MCIPLASSSGVIFGELHCLSRKKPQNIFAEWFVDDNTQSVKTKMSNKFTMRFEKRLKFLTQILGFCNVTGFWKDKKIWHAANSGTFELGPASIPFFYSSGAQN